MSQTTRSEPVHIRKQACVTHSASRMNTLTHRKIHREVKEVVCVCVCVCVCV